MITPLSSIADKIASKKGMRKDDFLKNCKDCSLIVDDEEFETALSYINNLGLETTVKDEKIFSASRFRDYKDEEFCVVDIETNGNSPKSDQIIEIGAIKYKNGEIIDRFESFVYSDFVPEYIERITHIAKDDLKDAPSLKSVLISFREFLGSSVFVAHNVRFDYNFISESLKRFGYDEMLNRRLCTINLAKKTIESEKYGLSYLQEKLDLNPQNRHRAYADALSALKIMEISLKQLPKEVKTTEDLIEFSNPPRRKKPKASL